MNLQAILASIKLNKSFFDALHHDPKEGEASSSTHQALDRCLRLVWSLLEEIMKGMIDVHQALGQLSCQMNHQLTSNQRVPDAARMMGKARMMGAGACICFLALC